MRSTTNAETVVAWRCASTPVLEYCHIRARVPSMSSQTAPAKAGPMRADARPASTPAKKRVGRGGRRCGSCTDRPLAIRAIARVDEQRHGTIGETFDDGRGGSRVGARSVPPGSTPRRAARTRRPASRCSHVVWMCVKVVWSAASGSWNAVAAHKRRLRPLHPSDRSNFVERRSAAKTRLANTDAARPSACLTPVRSTCATLRPFDGGHQPHARRHRPAQEHAAVASIGSTSRSPAPR